MDIEVKAKNVKVISFSAKCSDMFGASFRDDQDREICDYNGYVPGFFPGEHFGDYVQLDINLETGQILNWKKPTRAQLEDFFENTSGDLTFS